MNSVSPSSTLTQADFSPQEDALSALRSIPDAKGQRDLAEKLGWSLGKANYVLAALVEKGWVKAERFVSNRNKSGYRYFLTNDGANHKLVLAKSFILRKKREYEELEREVHEMEKHQGCSP